MKTSRLLAGAVFVAVLAPIVVHLLFKQEAPCPLLTATWTSGELLGYIGSLLGAVATIAAVLLTIRNGEAQRREDLRLSVLPCIAVRSLGRANRKSLLDSTPDREGKESCSPSAGNKSYGEISAKREYAVYTPSGFEYTPSLTEDQRNKIEYLTVPNEITPGLMIEESNPSHYDPLIFSNVGNGTAVNCSISIVKGDNIQEIPLKGLKSCSVRQMPYRAERYLGIFFDDITSEECYGKYLIIVNYEDTYGNRYVQVFELSIGLGENHRGISLSMSIVRYRCRGDELEAC